MDPADGPTDPADVSRDGEGGALSPLPPAGSARRLAAFAIDLALLIAVFVATGSGWGAAFAFCLYVSVSQKVAGCTLGKALVGLQVRSEDGAPLGWSSAILRSTVGYAASSFLLLGFLAILVDPRARAWHDRFFRTEVVQSPSRLSLAFLIDIGHGSPPLGRAAPTGNAPSGEGRGFWKSF